MVSTSTTCLAVFPDDEEPWSDLPVGQRGLIGIPVILGLRSLRCSQDGMVEIGMKSVSADARGSNLFLDDDHLVIAAELGQRKFSLLSILVPKPQISIRTLPKSSRIS